MSLHGLRISLVVVGVGAMVLGAPAWAQSSVGANVIAAPDYGSGVSAGALKDSNFNTPESDGRPGVMYFDLGAAAFKRGNYAYAIDMYKVSASWAYKPAQYDLGLMYFRGNGVPANRPLGAAWMVLAAERGTPLYVKVRDVMVTLETKAQFAETDTLWGKLRKTYGDKIALRRAKARWAWVKDQQTGSHTGHATGEMRVTVLDGLGNPLLSFQNHMNPGNTLDGSVAYRQFQQSTNPYSPIFLKPRTGTAVVEPLQQLELGKGDALVPKPNAAKVKKHGSQSAPASASSSQE